MTIETKPSTVESDLAGDPSIHSVGHDVAWKFQQGVEWRPVVTTSGTPWGYRYNMPLVIVSQIAPNRGPTIFCLTYIASTF